MKKIMLLLCLVVSPMMIIGWSTEKNDNVKESAQVQVSEDFTHAPKWVSDLSVVKEVAAVGIAKVGRAGISFARTEALSNGRDELVRMISVKVSNIVKNFGQTTGVEDAQIEKVTSQVSRQITSEILIGSRQKEMWVSPSENVYVLVVIDTSLVKQTIQDGIESSYKNDEVLSRKWQDNSSYEKLNKKLDNEFDKIKQIIKDGIESSCKKDAVLWQQEQAKNAYEELDKEMNRIKQTVKDGMELSYKRDAVLWKQWKARNAQEELNKEIDIWFDKTKQTIKDSIASSYKKDAAQWQQNQSKDASCNDLKMIDEKFDKIKQMIKDYIELSYKNCEILWQQEQARDAQEELNKETVNKTVVTPKDEMLKQQKQASNAQEELSREIDKEFGKGKK